MSSPKRLTLECKAGPRRSFRSSKLRTLMQDNSACKINVICPVQSFPQKHSASRLPQISTTTPAVSSLNEGRIAIVTDVGMGCGGRGSVGRERGRRAGFKPVSNQERSNKLAAMQRPRLGAKRPIFGNSIGIALHRDIW